MLKCVKYILDINSRCDSDIDKIEYNNVKPILKPPHRSATIHDAAVAAGYPYVATIYYRTTRGGSGDT
jgi:hypothetical protein